MGALDGYLQVCTACLFEMITQFDNGCRLEHPVHVDHKLPMLKRINVAFDEEEI